MALIARLGCGDVEVEIRERTMGDISIYSAKRRICDPSEDAGSAILGIESKNEWWGKPHPIDFVTITAPSQSRLCIEFIVIHINSHHPQALDKLGRGATLEAANGQIRCGKAHF